MSASTFKTWLDAARPKTLPLAVACILSGSAVAAKSAHFSFALTALALITALLLQVLSNLANDYGDAVKGTDNDNRLGPKRAIQQGLVTPDTMKKAMIFNVALTVVVGAALVLTAFDKAADILSFIGLGALAIIAAICYTVGNKPYGYKGLGDLSVLIFFGWLGVAGTYYLQTGMISLTSGCQRRPVACWPLACSTSTTFVISTTTAPVANTPWWCAWARAGDAFIIWYCLAVPTFA